MAEVKNTKRKNVSIKINENVKYSLLAILAAFVVGILIMIWSGQFYSIGNFFKDIFTYNFGTSAGFAIFLGNFGWMIAIGLSLGVAFKAGQFNIGAAGQMISGGMVSFLFASNANMGGSGFLFTILISVLVGAFVALIIALLKTQFNINIVISSIMINWIIYYLLKFIGGTIAGSGSIILNNSLRMEWLSNIFGVSPMVNALNIGFIISIILVCVLAFAYKKTTWGYKQEILGQNPKVANYIGLNKNLEIIKTMVISGALAGFAGSIYYCGVLDTLPDPSTLSDMPGQGFQGITIALIGFSSPIGIFIAAILITMLNVPGLDGVIGSMDITGIMIAVMILFLSVVQYFIIYNPKQKGIKKDNEENIQETKINKKKEGK